MMMCNATLTLVEETNRVVAVLVETPGPQEMWTPVVPDGVHLRREGRRLLADHHIELGCEMEWSLHREAMEVGNYPTHRNGRTMWVDGMRGAKPHIPAIGDRAVDAALATGLRGVSRADMRKALEEAMRMEQP